MAFKIPLEEIMDFWTIVGIAFIVFATLIQAFAWTVVQAALVVGLTYVVIGILTGGFKRP